MSMNLPSGKQAENGEISLVPLGIGLWIVGLDIREPEIPWHSLAVLAYAMTFVALMTGAFELPGGRRFDVWRRLSDMMKAITLFAASMVWVSASVKRVPDTDVGVAIVLIPFGVLVVIGAGFFLRSMWIPLK
jgi:hypothetical protein